MGGTHKPAVCIGFSLTNHPASSSYWGYPHDYGNPQIDSARNTNFWGPKLLLRVTRPPQKDHNWSPDFFLAAWDVSNKPGITFGVLPIHVVFQPVGIGSHPTLFFWWEWIHSHDGSMVLEYLPTFTSYLWPSVGKYSSTMDPMGVQPVQQTRLCVRQQFPSLDIVLQFASMRSPFH